MTSRWRATRSSRGFSLRLTSGLIIMRWSANAGTTSKTAFTACGTLSRPFRGRRHPGPRSLTKPQSTSSTCAGKTTPTSRILMTSSAKTPCWSSKCGHWRRHGRVPSCRPTIQQQTAACTPTLRAAPSPPLMAVLTPAPSQSLKSCRAGRSCAWRPARGPTALAWPCHPWGPVLPTRQLSKDSLSLLS